MLVSWNLGYHSAVDPQFDDALVSEVWRSLDDKTRALTGRASLSGAKEDRASDGQN